MDVKSALVIVVILQFMDISFTHKILSMYRKLNPEDENWADLEINKSARRIFKMYGLTKASFIMQAISSAIFLIVFFGMIYILSFDLQFFAYAAFGGLTYVNVHHYSEYTRLKELLKKQFLQKDDEINKDG